MTGAERDADASGRPDPEDGFVSPDDPADDPAIAPLPGAVVIDAIRADAGVAAFSDLLAAPDRPDHLTLGGVAEGAVAPALAALLRSRPGRVVVVAEQEEDARRIARDLDALLEGAGDALELPPTDVGVDLEDLDPEDAEADARAFATSLGERLRALRALMIRRDDRSVVVAASASAFLEILPDPSFVAAARRSVAVGELVELGELVATLVEHGYTRVPMVEAEGEVAVRGGIIDVFSPGAEDPVRIELFGDEVDSLRTFDPGTQTSRQPKDRVDLVLARTDELYHAARKRRATIVDYLAPDDADDEARSRLLVIVDPDRVAAKAKARAGVLGDRAHASVDAIAGTAPPRGVAVASIRALPRADDEPGADLDTAPALLLTGGDLAATTAAVADAAASGRTVWVTARRAPQLARIRELLDDDAPVRFATSPLERGFTAKAAGVTFVTAADLLTGARRPTVRSKSKRRAESRAIDSFLDLAPGDYVVHLNHGVGRFRGVERIEQQGKSRDCIKLEYKDGAILYVPAERLDLIQRYVGVQSMAPRLNSLSGAGWSRKKAAAKKAVMDLAADLLELQAERELRKGTAFPDDGDWQRAFEAAFPYDETDDQVKAADAVRGDMQRQRPMDRLVCGDVGYGKTEIALRAAFRAAASGKQVAVLVPTTVLAQQHHDTFRDRFAAWPLEVDVLSRFRTPREQKGVVERVASGAVDIVIGTHRLVSADVVFKDLGLVIIDEEQRFGVRHKERLRRLRSTVDVLTLTATPIPRTLHMSLVGIKGISALETPPPGRLSIKTDVRRFDPKLVKNAIRRELARDGQVYFVHDRVGSIDAVRQMIEREVPEARVLIVHGQMPERAIEDVMLRFVKGLADVLVCTSIIESGLDIARANTIIINNADRFGLAELHQLRGRVGRYHHRAWCWLLVPRDRPVNKPALERLQALAEYSELGAGFRIAMRDLEIRGSGNLLGAEQSGHIATIGYELYCRLLKTAIEDRREGRTAEVSPAEMEVALGVEGFVPEDYVPDVRLRIEVYRRLTRAASPGDVAALRVELRDRYGEPPRVVENLLEVRLLKSILEQLAVRKVWQEDKVVAVRADDLKPLLRRLHHVRERIRVIDEELLYLALDELDPPPEKVLEHLLEWLGVEPPSAAPRRRGGDAKRKRGRRGGRGPRRAAASKQAGRAR